MSVEQHVQVLKPHQQAAQPQPRRSQAALLQACRWPGAGSEIPLREEFFRFLLALHAFIAALQCSN